VSLPVPGSVDNPFVYQDNVLIQSRIERTAPYFLYEDNAGNLLEGRISPGRYAIKVIGKGTRNNFTIGTLACDCEPSIYSVDITFVHDWSCLKLMWHRSS
jgi:hypothetical protein